MIYCIESLNCESRNTHVLFMSFQDQSFWDKVSQKKHENEIKSNFKAFRLQALILMTAFQPLILPNMPIFLFLKTFGVLQKKKKKKL